MNGEIEEYLNAVNALDRDTMFRLRDQVIAAMAVFNSNLSLNAPYSRFDFVNRFIVLGPNILTHSDIRFNLGPVIKALMELAIYRAVNSTRDKAQWKRAAMKFQQMLGRVKKGP